MSGGDVELCFRIWADGFQYEVGEDGDGLDMVRVSYVVNKERGQEVMFSTECARAIADAILRVAEHIEAREKKAGAL